MQSNKKGAAACKKKSLQQILENKERIYPWITAPDSEVYIMKSTDRFYVV